MKDENLDKLMDLIGLLAADLVAYHEQPPADRNTTIRQAILVLKACRLANSDLNYENSRLKLALRRCQNAIEAERQYIGGSEVFR